MANAFGVRGPAGNSLLEDGHNIHYQISSERRKGLWPGTVIAACRVSTDERTLGSRNWFEVSCEECLKRDPSLLGRVNGDGRCLQCGGGRVIKAIGGLIGRLTIDGLPTHGPVGEAAITCPICKGSGTRR